MALNLFAPAEPGEGFDMTSICQDHAERRELALGNVFALHRRAEGKMLRVLAGAVWVTETPARGDRILREGDDFLLEGRYPYVFEALSGASVEVQ